MDIKTFEKQSGHISIFNTFAIPHVDISIGHYGYEKTTTNKNTLTNGEYPTFRLYYIIDGNVTFRVNGKTFRLRKNQCFYMRPDMDIVCQTDPQNPATFYWVSFTGANVLYYLQTMGFKENVYFIYIPTELQNKLHHAFYSSLTLDDSSEYLKDIIFSEYFFKITKILSMASQTAQAEKKPKPKKKYIERALEIINDRYMDPSFSIRDVAKELFLHENYLSKIFKDETKISFSSYLVRYRIEKSCTLIQQGYTSVMEIAFATGFADPLYFSKVFKKYTQASPSELIRNVNAKNEQS